MNNLKIKLRSIYVGVGMRGWDGYLASISYMYWMPLHELSQLAMASMGSPHLAAEFARSQGASGVGTQPG